MPTEVKVPKDRGSWNSWLEFFFSTLGSMVGLGNIWRFPSLCYRSGGGAFLVPFLVAMLLCGCPLMLIETGYCQYSHLGPGKVWEICPLFKGMGIATIIYNFACSSFYCIVMAYPLYYAAMSCQPDLPWASCGHSWNTDNCREANYTARSLEVLDAVVVAVTNGTKQLINGTTQLGSDVHNVTDDQGSVLRNITALNGTVRGPEEEFWLYGVLDISSGLSDSGSVRWPLLICLAVAWFTIFLCLIKGIKSMGKAAYVAASLPYLILTCLLVRGCLLPGAGVGLYYYMVPEWEQLADFDVWRNATAQVMFSMGMGSGLLNTLASYNKFNNNLQRDAFLLPVMDTVTSIFAGLVIFVYLGHMSYLTGKHMDNVVDEGPGLVFIAYPSALSTLPIPQFWSIIFFLMLFCVGLDSQFLHVQIVITALTDRYPHKLRSRGRLLTAVVCFIFFLLGLPYTMQSGFYWLTLMNHYVPSVCLMLLALTEVVVLAWVYGTKRLCRDLETMLGYPVLPFWAPTWKVITPGFVLVLWLTGLLDFRTIGSIYPGYPFWSDLLGLAISLLPIVPVVIVAARTLVRAKGTPLQRLRESVKPSPLWCSAEVTAPDPIMPEMETLTKQIQDERI